MRAAAVCVMMLFTGTAHAQSQGAGPLSTASAFDVAADPQTYKGKRVRITGCDLFNAKLATSTVNCAVFGKNGQQIGNLLVDLKKMKADDRRKALAECGGDDAADACEGLPVTGRITTIGSMGVLVTDAAIEWR